MSTQQASTRLPVIDVEAFSPERKAPEITAKELQGALEDVGFLSIVGHGIEWRIVTDMCNWAARYHNLSDVTKLNHEMTSTLMGYVGLGGAKRGGSPPCPQRRLFHGAPWFEKKSVSR